MKIAIQLFGNLRTYKQCSPTIKKHLIDQYDCDIFIHTWSTLDHVSQTHHKYSLKNSPIVTEDTVKKYYNTLLGEKADKDSENEHILLETQTEKDLGTITLFNNTTMSVFGIHKLFHSMTMANTLREKYAEKHSVVYDFVLCTRPDIFFHKKFSIEYFLENLSKKEITTAFFSSAVKTVNIQNISKHLGGTDLIFFAKPDVISHIFANKEAILSKSIPTTMLPYVPEYHFIQTIEELGYIPYFIDYSINKDFHIERLITKKTLFKRILQVKITKKLFLLNILTLLNKEIFSIQCTFFGSFKIDISLGRRLF